MPYSFTFFMFYHIQSRPNPFLGISHYFSLLLWDHNTSLSALWCSTEAKAQLKQMLRTSLLKRPYFLHVLPSANPGSDLR